MKFSPLDQCRQEHNAAPAGDEYFRNASERIEDLVLINFDSESHVVSWSRGAEYLLGYVESESIGQLNRVLAEGLAEDCGWTTRRDGSEFCGRWVTTAMRDTSGNLRGFAKVLRDETKRNHAGDVMKESLEEKEILLHEFHHHVKNNFQVISSLLSLQASQSPDRQVQRIVDGLQGRVRSIAALHETLYSSRNSGSIVFGPYMHRIVRDLIGSFGIDQERIQLRVDADDTVLPTEQALPLGLVVNELVSNALKHAFPGQRPGTVSVQFRHRKDISEEISDRAWCELSVYDDGIGIRNAEELWEGKSTGLKIVRLLARQLHGRVHLDQRANTRFEVRFPLDEHRFAAS